MNELILNIIGILIIVGLIYFLFTFIRNHDKRKNYYKEIIKSKRGYREKRNNNKRK